MNTYGLELCRSDMGDGGWSLHAPELDDDDGQSLPLLSGPAEWLNYDDFDCETWSRPNQADYDAAAARAATAAAR